MDGYQNQQAGGEGYTFQPGAQPSIQSSIQPSNQPSNQQGIQPGIQPNIQSNIQQHIVPNVQQQPGYDLLNRLGVSNVSQQLAKAEQLLNKVKQDLQQAHNQLQTQMDAQSRQILNTQQAIEQAIQQFRVVENVVLNRQSGNLQ